MAAETTPGPTVPRRQLGRHLRAAQPGEADDQAGCPGAGVVRAQAVADRDRPDRAASLDVAAMCRVYGASAEVTEGLVWLAQETKGRGWWHAQGRRHPGLAEPLPRPGGSRLAAAPVRVRADPESAPDGGLPRR